MTIRAQTAIDVRYVVNDHALETLTEREQFRVLTNDDTAIIECRPNVFDLTVMQALSYFTQTLPSDFMVEHEPETATFERLVNEWHVECGTTSSVAEMAMCPAYQQIIAMGKRAVPLILKQLEAEGDDPDHWFWALNSITGEDPVAPEDRGNTRKMSAAWLQWGRNQQVVR
jgi:hypothetical protein